MFLLSFHASASGNQKAVQRVFKRRHNPSGKVFRLLPMTLLTVTKCPDFLLRKWGSRDFVKAIVAK